MLALLKSEWACVCSIIMRVTSLRCEPTRAEQHAIRTPIRAIVRPMCLLRTCAVCSAWSNWCEPATIRLIERNSSPTHKPESGLCIISQSCSSDEGHHLVLGAVVGLQSPDIVGRPKLSGIQPNEKEISHGRVRGKQTGVASQWARWLHRLVRRYKLPLAGINVTGMSTSRFWPGRAFHRINPLIASASSSG